MRTRLLSSLFGTLALVSACECDVDVGTRDAGRRDAGFRPRTDECGNGVDDDRNGRIDDGCVCGQGDMQPCFSGDFSGQGVGACRDGTQICDVQEFGDWGMFACVGATLPSPELCDNIDNDCDGARDEDCPCDVGATRACSDEFAIAPCMPGVQTCRAGRWSSCEGATLPSPDLCTDMVDNDCDGVVNEGCTCVSVPEECNDRIDNDCDGEIDELSCAPLPDAGVRDAGIDGGFVPPTCTPTLTRVASFPGLGYIGNLGFSGPDLYAVASRASMGEVVRVDLTSASLTAVATDPFIFSMQVDGGRLCFGPSSSAVRCGPTAGPFTSLPLPPGTVGISTAVAMSGDDVYWFASATDGVTSPQLPVLLRTTAGVTTELWRASATETAYVLRQMEADPSGVLVVLQDINSVSFINSGGGMSGTTGALSEDGTHEHITHFSRTGTRTALWNTGALPVAPRAPTDPVPHWNRLAASVGASLRAGTIVWAEASEAWGISSEFGVPTPSGDNPFRLRIRPRDGSSPMRTLIDDMGVARRNVWWIHQTERFVYAMTQNNLPGDGSISRLERVPLAGGPVELIQRFDIGVDNRIPLSGVAQLGDCLYVAIRVGNFDSEIHTIRVE